MTSLQTKAHAASAERVTDAFATVSEALRGLTTAERAAVVECVTIETISLATAVAELA